MFVLGRWRPPVVTIIYKSIMSTGCAIPYGPTLKDSLCPLLPRHRSSRQVPFQVICDRWLSNRRCFIDSDKFEKDQPQN